jgi:hypothetical protein
MVRGSIPEHLEMGRRSRGGERRPGRRLIAVSFVARFLVPLFGI